MKLGNVLTYKKGRSPLIGFESEKQVLYLTPEYLRGNAAGNFISDFPAKVEVVDGDLLLLWDGSNAGEFFKGKSGVLSSTMVKFNFSLNVFNPEFLFYQLKGFEGYIKSQTNGSGIPHVDRELLLGLEVKEFKETEQSHIAKILSTTDKAIGNTEALITKYQRIKTGLMQDLLTRGIDERGNVRDKTTHKFLVKNGIEVPVEWEVKEIQEFAHIISGSTPSTSIPEFWGGPINWFTPNDLSKFNGIYTIKSERQITIEGLNSCSANYLAKGSIIISSRAPIDYIAIANEECCTNQGCKSLVFREPSRHNSEFHFFNFLYNMPRIKNLGEGTTFAEISKTSLSTVLIPFPKSIYEQKDIADKLLQINDLIEISQENHSKLCSLKTGLMQDLLNGKVRVPEEMIKWSHEQ